MRYFFDTTDRHGLAVDDVGHECASNNDARILAEKALGELFCEALPDGGEETFTISVRDENGQAIFTGRLVFTGGWQTSRR